MLYKLRRLTVFKTNLNTGISEKQKALEAEVVNTEMKLESQKKVLAEEISKLQTAKEETKCIESKLANVQGRIKSLTKELEDMKHQTSSSDKENISDKYAAIFIIYVLCYIFV